LAHVRDSVGAAARWAEPYSEAMALRGGTYRVGPQSGRLLVKTSRTGLGARAGHDLTIEATGWEGAVAVNTAEPAQSSVSVDVEVDSLEVREGTGGVKPLTDSDRADIQRIIREKILRTAQHPVIMFRSTRVGGSPESFAADGDLTIMGATHPVTVRGTVSADGRVRGTATVVQTQWGIKPYSALLGALKVADEVLIEVDAMLIPAK
jgi:polyisoprenoid-binding protein YceI